MSAETSSRKWTRRQFSQAVAAGAGAAVAVRSGLASLPAPAAGLAFVASAPNGEFGAIHAFRVTASCWTPLRIVPAASPAHLLLHPTLPVLYAVHNVEEWEHLPRGAVSAYRVDRASGSLTHLHTQALSLSATHPRHAVLMADASHLFVAAEGGGIYNGLRVTTDGTLSPASVIHKEFGLEEGGVSKTSAPNTLALLPDGSLLAADAGTETLTNFVFKGNSLIARYRTRVHRGEGPSNLTLSPDGLYAYTAASGGGLARRHRLVHGKATDETELGYHLPTPLAAAAPYVQNVASLVMV